MLPAFFRKLWFKIAVPTAILTFICIEITVSFLLNRSLEQTRIEVQKTLSVVASTAALSISADDHLAALSADTSVSRMAFKRIHSQMNRIRERIGFKEHLYTLLPNSGDTTRFGVMSHPTSFSGDIHVFRDTSVRSAFEQAFHQNKTTYTNIYNDDNGTWISAFAPILDTKGEAVAVLEADLTYKEYFATEQKLKLEANIARVAGAFVSGLLGMILGLLIAKPIAAVSNAVSTIADNNFQGNIKIPFMLKYLPDETTSLIKNFNQMATQLGTTLSALRQANIRLESLDNAKSVFLKFVAHELRTPLNGLNSLSFIPKLQELEPDSAEILEGGIQSAERLKLFAFSAEQYIQALNHKPSEKPEENANFCEMMQYVLEDFRIKADDAGIHCTYKETHNLLPISIPYDVVEKIVSPLLDNAIKFNTYNGSLTIEVQLINSMICCMVEDTGIGFPSLYSEQIFEPFFVVDIQGHSRGSGVSLATAKVLAEHYNGTIRANSFGEKGGSLFIVTLPLAD
ncbi:MAG: HAMP domain-containing histidine kinase [Ignavibacteriae bacterium]|nr:HAMP domain-containing histidine kinase [Ignavibacteriota bacterium]